MEVKIWKIYQTTFYTPLYVFSNQEKQQSIPYQALPLTLFVEHTKKSWICLFLTWFYLLNIYLLNMLRCFQISSCYLRLLNILLLIIRTNCVERGFTHVKLCFWFLPVTFIHCCGNYRKLVLGNFTSEVTSTIIFIIF